MSQVSYGTITIIDTTDIARIYMVYAKSVSNTEPPSDELIWSEFIASAPGEGDFIWQKTVVEKAITEEKTYSDPVCITGSSGQGIEKIINYYCNYGQGRPEEDYNGWQLEIPEYDEEKPNYWIKIVVDYIDDTRVDFQASGIIANFTNDNIGICDSLKVNLEPIQEGSGTPSPTNIRPIRGHSGVNAYVSPTQSADDGTKYSQEFDVSLTPTSTDKVPYTFKAVGRDVYGDRESDKIVGGTVAWNQLVPTLDTLRAESGVTMTYADGVATISSTTARNGIYAPLSYRKGKYLFMCDLKATSEYSVILGATTAAFVSKTVTGDNRWHTIVGIGNSSASYNANAYIFATTIYENLQVRNYNIFDLTAMFGTTIADYIYSLEQATAGAGVAWFKKLFPKDYYPYDAGTLRSVEEVSAHEMVGFNQWDEEWENGYYDTSGQPASSSSNIRSKNYIKVVPNTAYYTKGTPLYVCQYDAGKNFVGARNDVSNGSFITGTNTRYIRFNMGGAYGNTYKNDICINLSDASLNGTYKPYVKHSYPLDSSLTLRGIPKLNANNNLYYDGDTYESDGTVTRNHVVDVFDGASVTDVRTYSGIQYARVIASQNIKALDGVTAALNMMASGGYSCVSGYGIADKTVLWVSNTQKVIRIFDNRFTDLATAQSILNSNPIYVQYPIATPTTETAEPFTNPQVVDNWGTEAYVTTGIVPVGHNTTYLTRDIFSGTLDLVTGVLTVDRSMVDLGSLNWSTPTENGRMSANAGAKAITSSTDLYGVISDTYATLTARDWYNTSAVGVTICGAGYGTDGNIGISDPNLAGKTSTQATSYVSGIYAVYPLATPQTYQLTPHQIQTLVGHNNVWSEQGDVEVKGHTLSKVDVIIYKDNGLTNVVEKSSEANINAAEALEKAKNSIVSTTQLWYQTNSTNVPSIPTNHSQIDAGSNTYNNWRSIRPSNNIANYRYYYYCYEYLHGDGTYSYSKEAILDTSNLSQYEIDSLNARIKKIWSNSTGSYMASGIGSNEVDINDSSTYGFNSKTTTTGISFNYNNYKTIELDGNIPALKFYEPSKTSQGTQTVQIDSNGMKLLKGGIIGGGVGSSYVPQDDFLYLSTQNYDSYLNVAGSGFRKNWRLVIGKYFGITEGGNAYLNGATVSGKIVALTGQIGGTYVGDSWGWTLSTGKLYSGTMGSDNSLHMRTFDLSTDEAISFNGSDLRSDWRLTVGSKFGVTKTGEIFATDANLSGIIKANEGSIGGWIIGVDRLYNGNIGDNNSAFLATTKLAGKVAGQTLSGGSGYTGWRLTVGSNFGVDNTGKLYATSAEITGTIRAGTIGVATNSANQINIGTSTTYASIYSGSHSSLSSPTNGFYIGADGISIGSTSGSNYFKVTSSGQITATGLTITGYATTSDNEDAKKVATDFLAKSGSSITLKTGWSSDYMTMTDDGTRIYCNSKALASFTTSGATIQAQNENDKINLSSSGLKVYKGGSLVAEFGDTINLQSSYGNLLISSTGVNLQSSYGNLLISSTGVNLNTSGSGTETFTFNNKPLLLVKAVTYKLPNALAASGLNALWKIRQALPTSITNSYTVLGIIGYDFNNVTSTQAGISYMNVFECGLPLAYKGTHINFCARNMSGSSIAKGLISVIIYLLVSPKVSNYTPDGIDVGYSDVTSGGE